jgi:flagellin-specific chaperone FliS
MDKKVYDNLNDLYDVMVDVLAAIEKLDYRLKNVEDKLDKIKKDL